MTSYELSEERNKNTIIADNTGGILMQRGEVDMCIVGTDRTLSNGDVCNKVGTYLKALAAHDNNIPFYVALPSSTIDWNIKNHTDIPIEEIGAIDFTFYRNFSSREWGYCQNKDLKSHWPRRKSFEELNSIFKYAARTDIQNKVKNIFYFY